MADSAFLSAAVDFASILTDDDDKNDTDVSNDTLVNDDFGNFSDFDFKDTPTPNHSHLGFLDNLVRLTSIKSLHNIHSAGPVL
jgi:hypothetical protein